MTVSLVIEGGDTTALDKLEGVLTNLNAHVLQIVQDTANEVWREVYPQMLADLRFYPPVPAGSRYKRTFRLQRGWVLDLEMASNGVTVVVKNATPYTRWVVGRLITESAAARATQRAFHARTGWIIALDTTRLWVNRFKDAFIVAFVDAILMDLRKQL